MPYQILADALLVVHAAFVVFVVLGGALVWLRPRAAWLHLPAVVWGVGIEWSGAICPLTPIEQWLRVQAGVGAYEGTFIEHYVWPLLYPAALTRSDQVVLGAVALAINAVAYGWLWRRRRSARNRSSVPTPGAGTGRMSRMRSCCWGVAVVLSLAACGPFAGSAERRAPVAGDPAPAAEGASPVAAAPAVSRPRIVILGDSLTAGLGLPAAEAYPARLQERVDLAGWQFEIVVAAVSGDTTAGGLRRLAWALDGDVRLLVVALGGNDALRGLPVEQMRDNLAAIVDEAAGRGIGVLLAGMEAPPNFGPAYTSSFRSVFRELAARRGLALLPFLLEGVAGVPALNQPDGIHPNAEGAERVAAHVWTALEPLLPRLEAEGSGTSAHVPNRR